MTSSVYSPLAIVGFGCDLPGGSSGPDEYWRTVVEGRSGIRSTEKERWSYSGYIDPDRRASERTYCGLGGLLDDFFLQHGAWCSADAAAFLNRTQQLIVSTCVQALEMAGISPQDPVLGRTGLVVGNMLADETYGDELLGEAAREILAGVVPDPAQRAPFEQRLDEEWPLSDPSNCDRILPSSLAHPVATILGLGDRALIVDGACASGLLVVDAAARFLHDATSSFVLAVGAMANMAITGSVSFSKIGGLSATGSYPLDEHASGLVPGEGAGAVLLCPLDLAMKKGMNVYGVIRGSATRTDGRGKAIYAPNSRGQIAAMRGALAGGGFGPNDIDHVETHATGTPAGDAEELTSILAVTQGRDGGPVSLGSVKALLGHGFPAAGIANLVKVLLCFEHGSFAPVHGVETPHTMIREHPADFVVHRDGAPWPLPERGRPRRALVNAFGFGGVDSTVCVEQFDAEYHRSIADTSPADHTERSRAVAVVAAAQCSVEKGNETSLIIDDIDFDWRHFKVPPVLVPHMDGAQRLALEATRRLLDDVEIEDPDRWGIILGQPSGLEGLARRALKVRAPEVLEALGGVASAAHTDVVAGVEAAIAQLPATVEASLPGYMDNIVAGRLANVFDFRGPSMVLDAGEISFAAAVDLASRYLDEGECDAMVIGSAFASRSRMHRLVGMAAEGRGAETMVARSMDWAREHPNEVRAVIEVDVSRSGPQSTTGSASDTARTPTARWALEAMNDSYASGSAHGHQVGRELEHAMTVYGSLEDYDRATRQVDSQPALSLSDESHPAAPLATGSVPAESLPTGSHLNESHAVGSLVEDGVVAYAAGDSVMECLTRLSAADGSMVGADADYRFRMAVANPSPEQAGVIWRLLGHGGRPEEVVQ